jgi:hypothetical protein
MLKNKIKQNAEAVHLQYKTRKKEEKKKLCHYLQETMLERLMIHHVIFNDIS